MTIINKGGAEALRKKIEVHNPLGARYEKEILAQFNALHDKDIWDDHELEKYLLKDRIKAVEEMGKKRSYPMDLVRFNPSGASATVMDLWLKAKGYKEYTTRYPYHKRWTRNATAVHEAVQRDLIYAEKYTESFFRVARTNGGMPAWEHNVLSWKELEHNGQQFLISGMLDGILVHEATGNYVGFEFKTKSNTIAQVGDYLMKGPYDYHVDQAVAYYLLTGVRDYILMYEALAKPRWLDMEEARNDTRAFHVYVTDEMAERLLDKFAHVTKLVVENEVPEVQELGFFSGYQHLFDEEGRFKEDSKPELYRSYRGEK